MTKQREDEGMDYTTVTAGGHEYVDTVNGVDVLGALEVEHIRPILDNLQEFQPGGRWPKGMRRRKPKYCFDNAMSTWCRYHLRYAEGFVRGAGLNMWIHHAWNLDSDGRVVDRTLPDGREYVGAVIDDKDLLEWWQKWT